MSGNLWQCAAYPRILAAINLADFARQNPRV
jgi:aerobic-type carbon monoxide dehydrogenase small subunit (CoxS/CutS family)